MKNRYIILAILIVVLLSVIVVYFLLSKKKGAHALSKAETRQMPFSVHVGQTGEKKRLMQLS